MSRVSRSLRMSRIFPSSLAARRKWRYPSAVTAKPSGTFTPWLVNAVNISPRDAFFPPASGTSSMPMSANHLMNLGEPD